MMKVEFSGTPTEVVSDMHAFLGSAGPAADPVPAPVAASQVSDVPEPKPDTPEEKPAPKSDARKFGESDADKARRTKEQMATDKEIEELAGALGVEIDKTVPADRLVIALREQSASAGGTKPNISENPEDRKEPTEEVQTFTRDDVREWLGKYAEKFGMATAQKEGPSLLGAPKLSEIPDDPAAFAKAVTNLQAAIEADING